MRTQSGRPALVLAAVLMAVAGLTACTPDGGPTPSPSPSTTTGAPSSPLAHRPARLPVAGHRDDVTGAVALRGPADARPGAGQRRARHHGQAVRYRHRDQLHARLPGRCSCGRKPASQRRRGVHRHQEQPCHPQPRSGRKDQVCTQQYGGPQTAADRHRRRGRPSGSGELHPAVTAVKSPPGAPQRTSWAHPAGRARPLHLQQEEWLPRQAAHQQRVRRYADPYLERRSAGRKHPVEDFLFTYYTQKPGQLLRWHPGAGVVLSGPEAAARTGWKYYRAADDAELAAAGLPAELTGRDCRRRRVPQGPPGGTAVRRDHPRGDRRAARPSSAASGCTSGPWSTGRTNSTSGMSTCSCAWAPNAPTRWWRKTGSGVRISTPSVSTHRTPFH